MDTIEHKQLVLNQELISLVSSIMPHDALERSQITEILAWLASTSDIYRRFKPNIPPKHLVSYFVLFDETRRKVLLGDHINAKLWLPSGGHVEALEAPYDTVIRECYEELKIKAQFIFPKPIFASITQTSGLTKGHVDINLWYVLKGDSTAAIDFDTCEYTKVHWFDIDVLYNLETDVHLSRFIDKLLTLI